MYLQYFRNAAFNPYTMNLHTSTFVFRRAYFQNRFEKMKNFSIKKKRLYKRTVYLSDKQSSENYSEKIFTLTYYTLK